MSLGKFFKFLYITPFTFFPLGSTPVRSACFMTHLDIVSYLVENGADIQRGNYNGGTCLINSVQSVQLCLYLLRHGATVNARDIQNKTALHYAIQVIDKKDNFYSIRKLELWLTLKKLLEASINKPLIFA